MASLWVCRALLQADGLLDAVPALAGSVQLCVQILLASRWRSWQRLIVEANLPEGPNHHDRHTQG